MFTKTAYSGISGSIDDVARLFANEGVLNKGNSVMGEAIGQVPELTVNISSNTTSNTMPILITTVDNVVSPTLNGSDQD
ncbi:hypothetical protein Tco_1309478 [Tanacetum coccineum]